MNLREDGLGGRTNVGEGGLSGGNAEFPTGLELPPCRKPSIDPAAEGLPTFLGATAQLGTALCPLLRRGYKPESPHRYPWYRDNILGHLRTELSLVELASARVGDIRYAPGSLKICSKKISERGMIEAFESFLTIRDELAKAHPYLVQDPSAPFFAARDGGPLLVSHRPLGTREGVRERFVELRDQLAAFLFRRRDECSLEQISTITVKEFDTYAKSNRGALICGRTLEEFGREYHEVRNAWLSEVQDLVALLKGHSFRKKETPLVAEIARLEELKSSVPLASEEERRLRELQGIRCGLEEEERERIRKDLLMRKHQATKRRSRMVESLNEALVEDPREVPPETSIMPVYAPNTKSLFIGTDGGRIIGDI